MADRGLFDIAAVEVGARNLGQPRPALLLGLAGQGLVGRGRRLAHHPAALVHGVLGVQAENQTAEGDDDGGKEEHMGCHRTLLAGGHGDPPCWLSVRMLGQPKDTTSPFLVKESAYCCILTTYVYA